MTAGIFSYAGGELELFQSATNWKRYWSGVVRPYIGRRVIEVGAGLGANIPFLSCGGDWTCVEPDPVLARQLSLRIEAGELSQDCQVVNATLADLPVENTVDTILYIDVLEHIKDDRAEVGEAARRLQPGGHLVVLGPAHPWLFSPFDAAIGHYRRYTVASLAALTSPELDPVGFRYLDAVGMFASAANRFLMRTERPSQAQIHFWDRVLVPTSRLLDGMLGYRAGKSVLAIWRRR